MPEFVVEVETLADIADAEFLDRLAERIYADEVLVDPLLALNDSGSVSASFCVVADTASEAAQRGVPAFASALMAAQPLEAPARRTSAEASVAGFAVKPAAEREPLPA